MPWGYEGRRGHRQESTFPPPPLVSYREYTRATVPSSLKSEASKFGLLGEHTTNPCFLRSTLFPTSGQGRRHQSLNCLPQKAERLTLNTFASDWLERHRLNHDGSKHCKKKMSKEQINIHFTMKWQKGVLLTLKFASEHSSPNDCLPSVRACPKTKGAFKSAFCRLKVSSTAKDT